MVCSALPVLRSVVVGTPVGGGLRVPPRAWGAGLAVKGQAGGLVGAGRVAWCVVLGGARMGLWGRMRA